MLNSLINFKRLFSSKKHKESKVLWEGSGRIHKILHTGNSDFYDCANCNEYFESNNGVETEHGE